MIQRKEEAPMPSYRAARTSEDVMRELTAILREMKDPGIAEAMLLDR